MARKISKQRFAICVSNAGSDDLVILKLYRILPDAGADQESFLRVVDDSGEDYLYPASRFVIIELPQAVPEQLLTVPTSRGG
jgi:hypothetical protein